MQQENHGRIAVGQAADFVVVDRDVAMASPQHLAATRVPSTWVDGRRVWPRGDRRSDTLQL
jgi:hypothetical protein